MRRNTANASLKQILMDRIKQKTEQEYIESYDGREGCLIIVAVFGALCLLASGLTMIILIIKAII